MANDAQVPLLHESRDDVSTLGPPSSTASIAERSSSSNERNRKRNITRYISFASAILNCLCAGSLTAYSLYGHIFQERLYYTQYQVNIIIVAAELAMYLPVPVIGYLCDRIGPAPLSFASAILFGSGYLLAALTYRSGATELGKMSHERGWPFPIMVVAFVALGLATAGMYLGSVATCAKNFGKGRYRGLALATPIASFGLSGMWQSQVASRFLYEKRPDGSKGDVDVFKFFIFLSIVLFLVGLLGSLGLKVVGEEELIDDAVEELEASGLLDSSAFFPRSNGHIGYGSIEGNDSGSLQSIEDIAKAHDEEEARKKTWLLNEQTRMFLNDHTMWFLAGGFFLVTGPGDTFINNLGTIIGTLYSPLSDPANLPTTAATHVSVVAVTSTIARIIAGTVTDMLAPASPSHQFRGSASNSIATLPLQNKRFTVSRVAFLLGFAVLMSIGQALLASGFVQNHGERFWVVSALIGSGYGAVFSLTPIIITVIWGVENFGTNWGIIAMAPAFGAVVWGLVYSSVYQWAAGRSSLTHGLEGGDEDIVDDILCYGKACYSASFWAMAVATWIACAMWLWAWKGKHGWSQRGIAV